MKIGINGGALWQDLGQLRAYARSAAEDGFASFWLSQGVALDALTSLTVLGLDSPGITLGAAVVPIHGRHPAALAMQALSAQAATGGRIVLGLGTSHRFVVEDFMGLSYEKPFGYMQEYLKALLPLLRGERVSYRGEQVGVSGQLTIDAPPPQVILAALGPKMLELAGREADGVVTWMVGPKTLSSFLVPAALHAAAEAGRPRPRIVVGMPVCVTSNEAVVRSEARAKLGFYSNVPAYRAVLDREGYRDASEVLIAGDEDHVASRLLELGEIGATDLRLTEMCTAEEDRHRTRALLKSML